MLDLLLEGVRLSSGILRTTDNEPGSRFGSFRVLSSTRFVVFFQKPVSLTTRERPSGFAPPLGEVSCLDAFWRF